jgi:hypothetical protein
MSAWEEECCEEAHTKQGLDTAFACSSRYFAAGDSQRSVTLTKNGQPEWGGSDWLQERAAQREGRLENYTPSTDDSEKLVNDLRHGRVSPFDMSTCPSTRSSGELSLEKIASEAPSRCA